MCAYLWLCRRFGYSQPHKGQRRSPPPCGITIYAGGFGCETIPQSHRLLLDCPTPYALGCFLRGHARQVGGNPNCAEEIRRRLIGQGEIPRHGLVLHSRQGKPWRLSVRRMSQLAISRTRSGFRAESPSGLRRQHEDLPPHPGSKSRARTI